MKYVRATLIFPDNGSMAEFIVSQLPKKVEIDADVNAITCEVSEEAVKVAQVLFKAVVQTLVPA